jgi:hypothetical protein
MIHARAVRSGDRVGDAIDAVGERAAGRAAVITQALEPVAQARRVNRRTGLRGSESERGTGQRRSAGQGEKRATRNHSLLLAVLVVDDRAPEANHHFFKRLIAPADVLRRDRD